MWLIKCLLLVTASLVFAWDPVRPGALVRKVGKLMIVDESIRVILNVANVSSIKDTLDHIDEGMIQVKSQLDESNKATSLQSKLVTKYEMVMNRLQNLRANFHEPERREKRAVAVTGGVIIGTLLVVTGVGLYADLTSKVKVLKNKLIR